MKSLDELRNLIENIIKKSGYGYINEKTFLKYDVDIISEIDYYFQKLNLSNDFSFKEKVYVVLTNDLNFKCGTCNNKTKFWNFKKGFKSYCSIACVSKNPLVKQKKIDSSFKKYGVENPNQSRIVREKTKKTNIKRYGGKTPSSFKKVRDKIHETNLKKYGVVNPFQSEEIKKKIKNSNLKKYGVEHNSHCKDVVEKRKKTSLKKYGVSNPNKSELIKNKTKVTRLNNYINDLALKLNISYNDIETELYGDVLIKNYCKKHLDGFFITKMNIINRFERQGIKNFCTKCNPISEQSSIKEKEVTEFIKTLNVKFEENNRAILNGKELDIYLPKHKLAIEFDGLYWHSELYNPNNYHLNKTVECEKHGISLIHIFEDEWIYKKEIVKSIIKTKLSLNENTIYGRKTKIREVSSKDSKEFLQTNHIQGNVNASIRLGLYYENELVSLMTFGKKRKALGSSSNDDDEYEMYRFCNKLNTNVVGGASKLFKYFVNNHTPKSVLSFADRRYFDGSMYKKLEFKKIGVTKPNYWYVKGVEKYHRFKFRKDVLVKEGYDKSKTEKQIMVERGFVRIYDCGNNKFEWSSKQK